MDRNELSMGGATFWVVAPPDYVSLPVIAVERLRGNELRLYAYYTVTCELAPDGTCWEGVRTTARKLGINKETVVNIRRVLEESGWIVVREHEKGTLEIMVKNDGVYGKTVLNINNNGTSSINVVVDNTAYYLRCLEEIERADNAKQLIASIGDYYAAVFNDIADYGRWGRVFNLANGSIQGNDAPLDLKRNAARLLLRLLQYASEREPRPTDVYLYITGAIRGSRPTVEVSRWEKENYG